MTSYLEYIQSLFYPAGTVLPTTAPPEYEAILRLADMAERASRLGDRPSLLDAWHATTGDTSWDPSASDEIEILHRTAQRSPVLSIRRGRRVVTFSARSYAEILTQDQILPFHGMRDAGSPDVQRVVICTNRHAVDPPRLGGAAPPDLRVTDWCHIATALSVCARTREDPYLRAWVRVLRGDFRPTRPLLFSGGVPTTVDEALHDSQPAMYGVPSGIPGLLRGNSRDILSTEITRFVDYSGEAGRFVLPGAILRSIVEGQINGRWSDLPWDVLGGSWPRWAAERIASGSARPVRVIPESPPGAPWDPVQLAFGSA